jgi:hypothetical protein
LTGCREGAQAAFKEAVAEIHRHPHAEEHERAVRLFYSTLRRRCLRFPARNELGATLTSLHQIAEPARSVVVLEGLKALPEADIQRVLEIDAKTLAKLREQTPVNTPALDELRGIELPGEVQEQIDEAVQTLEVKSGRSIFSNPATIAVGLGFLLLIAVIVWNVMGRAGTFPDEAVKIATSGGKASPDQFQPVENKVGDLDDWLMLKGFDSFRVPPGLENFVAAGVRIFKVENEPVAQAAIVSEKPMYFYSFASVPLGVSVVPEKTWRISEADHWVLAIREESGTCFLIAFRGTKPEMQRLLEKAGALP